MSNVHLELKVVLFKKNYVKDVYMSKVAMIRQCNIICVLLL